MKEEAYNGRCGDGPLDHGMHMHDFFACQVCIDEDFDLASQWASWETERVVVRLVSCHQRTNIDQKVL